MSARIAHRNNFNLIRLVAATQVLLVHSANHFEITGPLVTALKVVPGVPAFFFTSGYLIYYSYERTIQRGLANFFRNRVLRIYPALIACVLLSALSVYLIGYFDGIDVPAGEFTLWLIAQSTILQFYNPDFMRGYGVGVLNGALWTISVEVQFYLLMPAIYFLITRMKKLAWAMLIASMIVNVLVRQYLEWDNVLARLLYVSFIPWIYMFLFGAFVASTDGLRATFERIDLKFWIIFYVLSMNIIGPYVINASNAINPISFVLLAGCIMKLAYMDLRLPYGFNQFVRKNDLSYAVYLYHMPTINLLLYVRSEPALLNVLLTLLSVLLIAFLSWNLVEKPALGLKR
ncbi:MAG: acyltransferase family protein [Gammaproteobacteria bacterium]